MTHLRVHLVAASLILFLTGIAGASPADLSWAGAQQAATAAPHDRLRVFLDCHQCEFDYLRREIDFIDYVRDRTEADVHILVTAQGTGSGGMEVALKYIGLGRFNGVDDELKFATQQTSTNDERRSAFARVLKLGLVRYVTSTPMADRLQVVLKDAEKDEDAKENGATPRNDPWNFWVFRARANAAFEGEQRDQHRNFSGSFSGNRVTDAWKVVSSINLNRRENRFTLSDGKKLVDTSHDHNANAMVVKSLTEHWSASVRGRVGSTTFLNQDRSYRAGAGVEYSFFPYRVSATRELTAQLTVGVSHFDYTEPTIYDKEKETVGDARFVAAFDVTQPWGSTEATLETVTYFHDPARHRVELDGRLDIRLFKGFSLNLEGAISRIRDQIYLQKGDATDEEILLRRRQLATDYRYEFRMGFSYTFGSIFNNIVNTRF